jgi:hypothetical protein
MIKLRFHCCRKTLHINHYTIACRQPCGSAIRVAKPADCILPLYFGMFYLYRCMYWIIHCLSENFTGPIIDGLNPGHGFASRACKVHQPASWFDSRRCWPEPPNLGACARVPDRVTGRRRCRAVPYIACETATPWLGLPRSWWAEVGPSGALRDTSPEPPSASLSCPRSSPVGAADADPEDNERVA